jgi:16S rRNA (cytidine1402-2'-O)-methyltransferase
LAKNRQIRKEVDENATSSLRANVLARLDDVLTQPVEPALYLVATPIGHLADLTLRAMRILAGADIVYCEDTRHSRQLLNHYGLSRSLAPYHEHNEDRERPRVLEELAAGRSVALISDAGTPLVSDPGFKLVREALEAGHRVITVPGASAPIAALACSGLPTDCFLFAGFLPPRQAARRQRLAQLAEVPATLIFFEAPSRVAETLTDMAETLGATRDAVIARELTKLHEEVRRGRLADLAGSSDIPERGEFVLLVGPPVRQDASDDDIVQKLEAALERVSVRDASREVAEALGVPRSRVYDLAIKITRGER